MRRLPESHMGRGVGIAVDDIGQGTGVSGVGLDTLSLALGKGTPTACKRKCERARTPRGAVRANQLACLIGIQALRTSSRPPIMETVPKSRRYDRHPQQSPVIKSALAVPRVIQTQPHPYLAVLELNLQGRMAWSVADRPRNKGLLCIFAGHFDAEVILKVATPT